MRGVLLVSFLALALLANTEAISQTNPPAGKTAEQVREIDERVAEWLKTCLGDWDKATHMTKSEWRTTCQRVSAERRKFLIGAPDLTPVGTRRR
jgi:hypothetical protein